MEENKFNNFNDNRNFSETDVKKKGSMLMKLFFSILGLLIISCISYLIYFKNFKPIYTLDLNKYELSFFYGGEDGEGIADVKVKNNSNTRDDNITYDDSVKISEVMNTFNLSIDKKQGLKNGDEVTAKINLDKQLAEKYKIKITGDGERKDIVKGLDIKLSNKDQITDEIKEKLDNYVTEKADDYYTDSVYFRDIDDVDINIVDRYYKDANADKGVNSYLQIEYILEVNYSIEDEDNNKVNKKQYVTYIVNNVTFANGVINNYSVMRDNTLSNNDSSELNKELEKYKEKLINQGYKKLS